MLLMEKPAEAARLCGLTRLTDTLHGRWIREMVFGQGDMTLLAHRGSYKTTCLSFAMAVMLVVYPRKNLLFLRKTDSDVLEVLRQVKLLLATDAMQELTGRIYGSPVQVLRGDMWSVNTDCYAAIRGAPQLLGLGTGGSMTGKHADIILTDDIVNLQDRISAVERKRICLPSTPTKARLTATKSPTRTRCLLPSRRSTARSSRSRRACRPTSFPRL